MEHLPQKQQTFLAELLSGKSIRKAALDSKLSYAWARKLVCNAEPAAQPFYDEFEKQLGWQRERLMEQADRSKEALIQELEDLAEVCREGEVRYTKSGQQYRQKDLTNWKNSIVERGKLLGLYVEKKELSGKDGEPIKLDVESLGVLDKLPPKLLVQVLEALEEAEKAHEEPKPED